jgi:TRAP-type C4-dicarboxylate transport system substrate-binding protein
MKRTLLTLGVFILAIVFIGCKGSSERPGRAAQPSTGAASNAGGYDFSGDKKFNLTFSLYLPAGNSAYDWITPLVDGIREETAGTVNIEVFPGGTLAVGDETADAIRNGVADMGLWPTAYSLGTFPFSYMMEYPGINYSSAKAASYAFTEWIDAMKPAEVQDYKLIFSYCSGPGIFLIATKPVRRIGDFAGLQIRTNATNAPGVAAYGGTPVTLAMSEVYEAMRTGVIQGYLGLTESLVSFKLQEVTKYATLNPNFQCAFMVIMNKDVFNSMSLAQQAAVDRVAKRVWENTACSFLERDWAARAIQILRDANVEIITLPEEDQELMVSRTANLLNDYAKTLDRQGLKGTEGLELLKQLVEKYNAIYPTN